MKQFYLCAFAALALTACSEESASIEAALQGTVYEIGGQNIDLAGVEVTLVETGEVSVTDANGGFGFPALDEGKYTLGFATQVASLSHDGDVDGEHLRDNEIEVEVTRDGGDVDIRVAIENDGRVKDFTEGDFEDRHATRELRRPEESDRDVEGYVKLSHTSHGQRFKVAVFGLEPGTVIDIFIGDDKLGSAEAGEESACFVREDLDLENLSGRLVAVYLPDGEEKILFAEVPHLPAKKEHEEDGEGDDGREEGEGDHEEGEGDSAGEEPR